MADDKMKGDQDFKNHSNNSTTSPLQAKPASGLVSCIVFPLYFGF